MCRAVLFPDMHRCLPAPKSTATFSPWQRPPWLSKILFGSLLRAHSIFLCPPSLLYLIIWPSEEFCFVMSFTCSVSPHPAKTAGSTLSISLWLLSHLGSLEIVLGRFFSFYIIWSYFPEFMSTLPGSTASVLTGSPRLSPSNSGRTPGKQAA